MFKNIRSKERKKPTNKETKKNWNKFVKYLCLKT